MSWFDAAWYRRAPITVDLHSAGAGTAIDITAAIPSDWPAFWDNVMSTGADVRVTDGAGAPLTYQLDSWDYANRTGNIQVDDWTSAAPAATQQVWVYWDNPNGPSSAAGSFTVGGQAKTGSIEVGNPGSGSEYVLPAKPEKAGADTSQIILAKTPSEIQHVWWNLLPAMIKRRTKYNGSSLLEEIESVTYTVTHSDGTNTTSAMGITADIRTLHPAWVKTPIQAGSDTANYVVTLTATTSTGRTLNFHCTFKVRTIDAPTP